MRLFYFALFVLLPVLSEAQTNSRPMFVDGRTWKYVLKKPVYEPTEDYQTYQTTWKDFAYSWMVDGDSLVDGKKCKKIYCDSPEGHHLYGLGYEDGRKASICHLRIDPAFYPFVAEGEWHEVYDFNASVGSTTSLLNNYAVKSIGTASIENLDWNYIDAVFEIPGENVEMHRYIVEGVGCDRGLFDFENIVNNGSVSKYVGCYDGDECIFTREYFNYFDYVIGTDDKTGNHYPKVSIDGLAYGLNEIERTAMVANANQWVGELEIPEKVTFNGKNYTVDRIEWLAFDGCKTLTKVRIPKTVVEIQHYAGYKACQNPFRGCTSLERIEVDEENLNYCAVDGVLFSKDKTHLCCYPAGAKSEAYDIPDGVEWIGGDAFAYNPNLVSVTMPNSVTYTSFGLFANSKNLKSVKFSENLSYIGAYFFDYCESLRHLDIPASVSGFAESVFRWTGLESIVIRGTFPNGLRSDTFYFVDADRTVIYCQPSEIEKFKKVYKGTVLPLEDYYAGIAAPVPAPSVVPHDFDLQGRSVTGTPRPGIYIRQGRKYIGK